MDLINVQENSQPVIQTNSNLSRETKKVFTETISYIDNTVNKLDYINVEEIVKKLQNVVAYANEYNANLKNWFDDKFIADQQKLFKILNDYNESVVAFTELDKVIVNE